MDIKSQEFGSIETLMPGKKQTSHFANLHAMVKEVQHYNDIIKEQESVFDQYSKSVEDKRSSHPSKLNQTKNEELENYRGPSFFDQRANQNFTTNDDFLANEVMKPHKLIITKTSSGQDLKDHNKKSYSNNKIAP